MSARAATRAGRRAAERTFTDRCRVERPRGPGVVDEQTLRLTAPPPEVLHTDLRCAVSGPPQAAAAVATDEVGQRLAYEQNRVVRLPAEVHGLLVGDVVVITASRLDPDLVGRRLVVRSAERRTHLTARRLICEETTA